MLNKQTNSIKQFIVAGACLFSLAGCAQFWDWLDAQNIDPASSPDGDVVLCGANRLACPIGQFCDYPVRSACGDFGLPGVCRAIPEVCTNEYLPVCGCDGKTYSNRCGAASAGWGVLALGDCEGVCGGPGNDQCGAGEYCRFPLESCGDDDATGSCLPIDGEETCTQENEPVCGCDGNTYLNSCIAAAHGVSLAGLQTCPLPCGGATNVPCPEGEYCDLAAGDGCGVENAEGLCKPRPQACQTIYDPVCSCEQRTYDNACSAAAAGASVLGRGPCDVQVNPL